MINEETQELNPSGRVELKNIIDIYQKKNLDQNENDNENKIIEVNSNNNVKGNQINMTENIEDLQTKTDEFLLTDDKKKWSIKNLQIWKNYRTWLYLALIILIILIIEIII